MYELLWELRGATGLQFNYSSVITRQKLLKALVTSNGWSGIKNSRVLNYLFFKISKFLILSIPSKTLLFLSFHRNIIIRERKYKKQEDEAPQENLWKNGGLLWLEWLCIGKQKASSLSIVLYFRLFQLSNTLFQYIRKKRK